MNLFFNGKKKLVVLSLLLVGLLALVGCSSSDNDVTKHNVSGQIVDGDGNPVSGVILSAGDAGTCTTKEDGNWSFTNVKKGTKITLSVDSDNQNAVTFEPQAVTVEEDASDIEVEANFGGYQGYFSPEISYNNETGKTEITIEFDGDVRPVDSSTPLEDSITVVGTEKEFKANLVELEDGEDGDDNVGDYLEDKGLLIKIPGRIAGDLAVEVEANTLVKYDDDGEKLKRIRAIETDTVALSSNTNLKEDDDGDLDNCINTIKNDEQVVIVDWDADNDSMAKVKELFDDLAPEDSEAQITEIADRIDSDLNHEVTEDDTIVVQAEDGTTAEYAIKLAAEWSSVDVKSTNEDNGNETYSVDLDNGTITSGEVTLAWNTTVEELGDNLKVVAEDELVSVVDDDVDDDNVEAKVVNIDANITEESFDDLATVEDADDTLGGTQLGQGDDNNIAAKLVVKSKTDLKVYDVIVDEPNHTTNVEAAAQITPEDSTDDDVNYAVLDVDNDNKVVTLRSDLEGNVSVDSGALIFGGEEVIVGQEEAEITDYTDGVLEVTAQDGETTAEYEVKYAPGYIPEAMVADEAPYVLAIELGELDESIEDDKDYLDLEQDILDDFTVTVADSDANVLNVDLVDNPEDSDVAFLELDTKVIEGDEVTVAYDPDPSDDPYFISPSGNRILGFETQVVDNQVDAPNYVKVVSEVKDANAGTGTNKITIEFDDDVITDVGDTTEIAKDFTVQTTKDRDEELISGSQNPDVTDVDVVNSNQVELTLDSRILATEKIEVYYQPEYAADDDVLADIDTVISDSINLNEVYGLSTATGTGLDFINYETLASKTVKGENVVRLFEEGEGSDSTTGKSVPSNVAVPSVTDSYINDGEADNIYVEFDGDVTVDDTDVTVNDWFEVEGDREVVGATKASATAIKLELAEGVNEAAGDIDVTYAPQLRTDSSVPAGFLTDDNDNKILRNEVTAENNVESASFSTAYVNDQDDQDDPSQDGTTADEIFVEFDETVNITTDSAITVNVGGEEATITSVSGSGTDTTVTLTLDSKVKAGDDVTVSYTGDRTVNDLVDAEEIDTADNNTEEDVNVVDFDETVTNNVEAPTFASADINDGERNVLYLKLTELLDYADNNPDFDFNADYEDDFADDNFTVTVDGVENRVTNSELINHATDDETADPQIKLTLTNKLTDDDQEVEISYEADDYTDSMLQDSQGNVLQDFNNKEVNNNLDTPDFDTAVVEDDNPRIVSVDLDSPDSLDGATITTDSAIIRVNGVEEEVTSADDTGTTINYTLANPIEIGADDVTVDVGDTLVKDTTDSDTVSTLDSPIEATNNVAGPEIDSALIDDNASDTVVVTFNEDLAADGATGLYGANTTSLAAIQSDFAVTVKGANNPITAIDKGTANNKLELTLENKVAEGITGDDLNLTYNATQDLADQYGNRATVDYDGTITNDVVMDTTVDHTATHQTTSATAIDVIMTDDVDINGDSTNVGVEVIDANGNRVSVADVATTTDTVTITLAETLTAEQGNLTVYYAPTVQDNLVGAATDTDPVGKFSVNIENTL